MSKPKLISLWAAMLSICVLAPLPPTALAVERPTSGDAPESAVDSRRSKWAKKKQQKNEQQEQEQSSTASKFPNATRAEPKTSLSPAGQKSINGAYELIEAEDYAGAGKSLQQVLDNGKSSPYERALALQGLSSVAWEQQQAAQAISYAQQSLDTNALPNDAYFNGMYQLAQMTVSEEQYDKSLVLIDRWMSETRAEKADAYALRGNALYRLERFPESAAALQKALALSDAPNDSWTQMLLATYYEQDQYGEAAKVGESMLAKDPDNEKLISQLAAAYVQGEQEAKAIALLDGAYQRGALKSPEQIRQLYQLYNNSEQPQKAIDTINSGIAKGVLKEDEDTAKALAYAYVTTEQYDKAADAYAKAGGAAKDGEMDYQRGYLLVQELNKAAEGKAALESAIAKGVSKPGNAWVMIANAELELGNRAAARAAYQKAQGYPESRPLADAWLKGNK